MVIRYKIDMLNKDDSSGLGMTSLRTRQRLIERLTEKGIKDVRVLEAMRDIPRHLFLDEALASRAYEDLALPIGYQQTISQPYIVAKMTQILIEKDKLEIQPIKKALEIGTGCGYQAAILSKFSESVHTLERIKALHDKAVENLNLLKIKNVRLTLDDGTKLEKSSVKYDAILLAAAPLEIPEYVLKKLSIGGSLVAPVGRRDRQRLTLVKRMGRNEFKTKLLEEVLFVPLLDGLID